VDQEHATAREAEEEVLTPPVDGLDLLPGELLGDRLGRLGPRQALVQDLGALDAAADEQGLEGDADRLDLGQLRHTDSVTAVPRRPPDVDALLRLLDEHGVRYVLTGSGAAMLHGVDLVPGDLDVTPALDRENLERLAALLEAIGARPDPEAFGHWGEDGRWVRREPTPEELVAKPDPGDPDSFDHLYESEHGAFDVVPRLVGTYEELLPSAVEIDGIQVAGHAIVSRTIGRARGGSSASS